MARRTPPSWAASPPEARAFFLVKARASGKLLGAVRGHKCWHTIDRDAFDKPTTQVAEVSFARDVWKQSGLDVRVLAVRTKEPGAGKQIELWEDDDWSVKIYLTNLPDRLEDLARRYEERAGIEPLIAQWKNGWGIADVARRVEASMGPATFIAGGREPRRVAYVRVRCPRRPGSSSP